MDKQWIYDLTKDLENRIRAEMLTQNKFIIHQIGEMHMESGRLAGNLTKVISNRLRKRRYPIYSRKRNVNF